MEHVQRIGRGWSRRQHGEDSLPTVTSRRRALDRLEHAIAAGPTGPFLITGEAGAGKTWLARRLVHDLPACWRSVSVDLAMAMDGLELLRLIAHALGRSIKNRLGAARLQVHAALEDEAADGRRWLLVVDEAQRGSALAWDEIRAIINRMGQPGAFAAVAIVGRTELARVGSTLRQSACASALSVHVHLTPLDVDEASELLECGDCDDLEQRHALEELHRDSGGNPGVLLRLAQTHTGPWRSASTSGSRSVPAGPAQPHQPSASPPRLTSNVPARDQRPAAAQPRSDERIVDVQSSMLPLIPSRPPLRDEDGLVEVGWDGELEGELDATDGEGAPSGAGSSDDPVFGEESIEDRYARLQAWMEQTRSQGRAALSPTLDAHHGMPAGLVGPEELAEVESTTEAESPADAARPAVRAEGQHEFAPYSQLFTRFRQSKQPGS